MVDAALARVSSNPTLWFQQSSSPEVARKPSFSSLAIVASCASEPTSVGAAEAGAENGAETAAGAVVEGGGASWAAAASVARASLVWS